MPFVHDLIKETALVIKTDHNSIRCSNVEISGSEISALNGKRVIIAVPRGQVRHIKLSYDSDAKYPFCQYFLGFTLLSLGLIGLVVTFFASSRWGPLIQTESGNFVLPLIPIILWIMAGVGFWLLVGILRARYHLRIDTENRIYKIFFDKEVDIEEIQQFIRQAHMNFGYTIDVSILEKMLISS